jgi:hypothetical protein
LNTHARHLERPSPLPEWVPFVQTMFALMLLGGAAMELTASVWPGALPPQVAEVLARLHQDPWVAAWVVGSNAVHVVLAAGFLAGAYRICTRNRGRGLTLVCAATMLVMTLTGQGILAVRLYPSLWEQAFTSPMETAMLLSMVPAAISMSIYPAAAVVLVVRGGAARPGRPTRRPQAARDPGSSPRRSSVGPGGQKT